MTFRYLLSQITNVAKVLPSLVGTLSGAGWSNARLYKFVVYGIPKLINDLH